MTGSRAEVSTDGSVITLQERDPLGANTGTEDPYQTFGPEPKYVDLALPQHEFFLDGGGDPFNFGGGCSLDGMPMDCGRLDSAAANGSAVAGVFVGGHDRGQVSLMNNYFRHGNRIWVELPDFYMNTSSGRTWAGSPGVRQDGRKIVDGGFYFAEVAISGTQRQTRESENMRRFRETVQSVRDILGQNGGDNPCANFFGGAGLDALDGIVSRVNAQRENVTFTNLGDTSTGISMVIPTRVNPNEVGIPRTGSYVAVAPLSVAINTRGPFVSSFAARIGGQSSGTLASRVTQLLHEIGHLVITDTAATFRIIKNKGNRPGIYRQYDLTHLLALDGDDHSLSRTNTTSITNACGDQINRLDDGDN